MKRNLLILLSLFSTAVFSQVSYESSNYAVANDTLRISKSIELKKFNFDTTGTSFTWDYSALKPYTQVVEKFVTPGSTGYIFTPIQFQQSLDIAEPVSDTIYIGSLQLYNVYDFFDKTASLYQQQGTASEINGITVKSKYTAPDILYKFPMAYGNAKDSSNSGYDISIPNLIYYHHTQKRVNEIQGWGTLKTPYGSFDAIKLKSVVTCTDTINVKSTGIPSYSYTIIEYKWFTPGKKAPLLTVSQQVVGGYTVAMKAEYLDAPRYFEPTALFASAPVIPFVKEKVQFQNVSGNATTYNWNFGDPNSGSANTSTAVNPDHTFNLSGVYTVQLIASNPTFKDTFQLKIVVADSNEVIAAFSVAPLNPCVGDSIWITDLSKNATNYWIDFGDGTSPTTFSMSEGNVEFQYVYDQPGDYSIKWIVDNGTDGDTLVQVIHVSINPTANFTNGAATVGAPVTFTNTSSDVNSSTTYHWDFGFGATPRTSTEKNPVVTYGVSGNKTVVLFVTNGTHCGGSIVRSVSVTAADPNAVVADFAYSPVNLCSGDTLLFTNLSKNAKNYWIDFGDNTSPTTFTITEGDIEFEYFYETPGDYKVKWVVDNGTKGDTIIKTIHIAASPTAEFSVGAITVNTPVTFNNTSANTDANSSYYWNFGAGATPATSPDKNPTVTFAATGNKTVSLTVKNGINCSSTDTLTVVVNADITTGVRNTLAADNISIYPNPFTSQTAIEFTLSTKEEVAIGIYNLLGEKVADLNPGILSEGNHKIYYKNNTPGVYALKIRVGSVFVTRRVVATE